MLLWTVAFSPPPPPAWYWSGYRSYIFTKVTKKLKFVLKKSPVFIITQVPNGHQSYKILLTQKKIIGKEKSFDSLSQ